MQGVLDLRDRSLADVSSYRLAGEWAFYWEELLAPQAWDEGQKPPPGEWVKLPDAWNGPDGSGEGMRGYGYATYRLRVLLDSGGQQLALSVPIVQSAYKLWINGELKAEVGRVSDDAESSVPKYAPRLVFFDAEKDSVDIAIQVSNYHHRFGGLWQALELGNADALTAKLWAASGLEIALAGGLIAIGLHSLGLFLLRRKERAAVYFGLFCLFIGIHTFFSGEGIAYRYIPDMNWAAALRLESLCSSLSLPAAVMFIHCLYPKLLYPWYVKLVVGGSLAYAALVLFFPVPLFTYGIQWFYAASILSGVYITISLGKAALRKQEGAVLSLISAGTCMVSVAMDLLYSDYPPIPVGEWTRYGLLISVFLVSFMMSAKASKVAAAVETLSKQMHDMNMGLENKIRERTAQMEQTNRSLEKMNEDLARLETSRRHLLTNISHDLGTPMTLIQGYVEALLDGVVTEPQQQRKYLQIIHNRVVGLNRLIADLFQLSKLEARQMEFSVQPMNVGDFMRYFRERYELEVINAGLHFQAHIDEPAGELIYRKVKIDVDRIDQVLTNIIYNAVKHTPRGGTIELHMQADKQNLLVKVQDDGQGIDPEDLPYIFDRFYKKDKSRNTAGGGSGLGLAIAKEIIGYHGGRIWAESRKGYGACVAFELPLDTGTPPGF